MHDVTACTSIESVDSQFLTPQRQSCVIPVDQCPTLTSRSLLFRSPGTGADQVLPSLSSDMPLALSCGGRPVALPGARRTPSIPVRSRDRRSRGLCLQAVSAPRTQHEVARKVQFRSVRLACAAEAVEKLLYEGHSAPLSRTRQASSLPSTPLTSVAVPHTPSTVVHRSNNITTASCCPI